MIEWVSFAFVGVFSGITAGLLGLSGGIIMVPSLLYFRLRAAHYYIWCVRIYNL